MVGVQLAASQAPQVPSCRAAAQLVTLQVVLPQGVFLSQVQDFAFVLLEFHKVPVGLLSQPGRVPLDGSPALECVHWFPQFSRINVLLKQY